MPDYRLWNLAQAAVALTIAARSANTSVDGTVIDRGSDAAGVMFVVLTGTITDGSHLLVVRDSDDGVTFADASNGDVMGSGTVISTDDDAVKEIGYKGGKRYVRLRITTSGATTGGTFGAIALKTGGRKPVLR